MWEPVTYCLRAGALLLLLSGCVSLAEQFSATAAQLGLQREMVRGTQFEHVLYRKSGIPDKILHIYLDGDGTPWVAGRPADDPTPWNPLLLHLMVQDVAPAVYLGRPCYHGMAASKPCSSRFWLQDRYSVAVLDSLAAAVERILAKGSYTSIAWIGHSGGGTLALLLAPRFPQSTAVLTAAANLDTAAWAKYHGAANLGGSLNPATLSPLPAYIRQWHYGGGKDTVVPPELMTAAAAHQHSELIVFAGFDHVCCWERVWAALLDELSVVTAPASNMSYQTARTPTVPP